MSDKLLIFDLDGTLVDSGRDIANAVNHTRETLRKAPYPVETVLSFIGQGLENLLQRAVGIDPQDATTAPQARDIFTRYYLEHLLDNTRVYPNMREALTLLSHRPKVLITNKRGIFTTVILEKLSLRDFFMEVISGDTYPYMKPAASLLVDVAARHGIPCANTIVIGDGVSDVLLARNGGGKSCAHLAGLTPRALLLGLNPDYTYEHPLELVRLCQ